MLRRRAAIFFRRRSTGISWQGANRAVC